MKRKIAVLSIVCIMILGVLSGCGGFEPMDINLTEFTDLRFEGTDGAGVAVGEIDIDGIINYILQKQPKREEEKIRAYFNGLDIFIEPKTSLSNGDEVAVNYGFSHNNKEKVDKSLNFAFVEDAYTVLVENLDSLKEIDIFDFLEIEITGEGDDAEIILSNTHTDPVLKDIRFEVAEGVILDFDAIIPIVAVFEEDILTQAGYVLLITESQVEIEARPAATSVQTDNPVSNPPENPPADVKSESVEDDAPVNLNDEISEGLEEPMPIDPNAPALGFDPNNTEVGTVEIIDEDYISKSNHKDDGQDLPPYDPDEK